jgi:hypothetical protein
MALQVEGILFDTLAADPSSPAEGQVWYNTTSALFKIYRGGVVSSFTDAAQLTAHTSSSSNPHATTLEQARAAGGTLAGPINMGGYGITNVAQGSAPTDGANRQWVSDQITQALRGLDWQESVINRLATPVGSPVTGARYLIIATATGAWTGKENQIAQWDGTAWVFTVCTEGATVRDETGNIIYTFDGTAWANFGNAVNHSALLGLTGDDHTQYLKADGTRAMTGALNMGSQAITNVGLVDGVDVSAHAARHQPGGADAITTAAASGLDANSTNAAGSATSLARSDHSHAIDKTNGNITTVQGGASAAEGTGAGFSRRDHAHAVSTGTAVELTDSANAEGTGTPLARASHTHAHGNRGGGALHAAVGNPATGAGFHPTANFTATTNPTVSNDGSQGYSAGSRWINTSNTTEWVCISAAVGAAIWVQVSNAAAGFLPHKAGRAAAASFAGSPRKVTVTFTTPFADTNYSVQLQPVTQNGSTFIPTVESQLAGSFVINMVTSSISNLLYVNWTATKSGESS